MAKKPTTTPETPAETTTAAASTPPGPDPTVRVIFTETTATERECFRKDTPYEVPRSLVSEFLEKGIAKTA